MIIIKIRVPRRSGGGGYAVGSPVDERPVGVVDGLS